MHAESFSEVASAPKSVPTGDSSLALAEASREATSQSAECDGAQLRSRYTQKMTEALREQGILPELALDDGRKAELVKQCIESVPDKREAAQEIHVVEKGETIWGICRDYLREKNGKEPSNSDVNKLVKAVVKENEIKNPNQIHPGQKLKMPHESGEKPAVKPPMVPVVGPVDDPVAVKPEEPVKKDPDPTPANSKEAKTADSGLDYLRNRFDEVDLDNNEHVTKKEIDQFISDNEKTLSESEKEALQKVAAQEEHLEEQTKDDSMNEKGISIRDIDAAEKEMRAIEYAQKNFDPMDGDGNGHVTNREIQGFMRANADRISDEDRENCELLMDENSSLDDKCDDEPWFENGGFSKKDLQAGLDELGATTLAENEKLPLPDSAKDECEAVSEPVEIADFSSESLRVFDKIDSDSDGKLSGQELRAAALSDNYTGKDKQIATALYLSRNDIAELNDDDMFIQDSGISRNDLVKLDDEQKKNALEKPTVAKANEFLARDNNFAIADEDGNNFLSREEICQILQRTDLTEEERTSLTFLRENLNNVAEAGNDETGQERSGISQYDLDSFGNKTIEAIERNLQKAYESQKEQALRKDSKTGKDESANKSSARTTTPAAGKEVRSVAQTVLDTAAIVAGTALVGGSAMQAGLECGGQLMGGA